MEAVHLEKFTVTLLETAYVYACFSLKHTPCFPHLSPSPPLPDAEPSPRSLMCCSWHQTSRS